MRSFKELISSSIPTEDNVIQSKESIGPVLFDLSSQKISESFYQNCMSFYKKNLTNKFRDIYEGKEVNLSENKSVSHFEYRKPIEDRNQEYLRHQNEMLEKSKSLKKDIDGPIVFFGIGGSQLAPSFLHESLMTHLEHEVIFITGSDSDEFNEKLRGKDLSECLFIVVSKSFSTIETLDAYKKVTNLNFLERTYAITASPLEAKKIGIPEKNVLEFNPNTGGRFSVWSPVNFLMPLLLGEDSYTSFLEGGNLVDKEILERKEESIILALSIQDIFYNNVLGAQTNLILNYDWKLRSFSKYAQQIEMESNGKRVDLNGNKIEHQSNAIVWGGYGPESQHSFFQQIYQGTKNYNIYIIASIKDKNKLNFSQYLGQAKSLEEGTSENIESFKESESKAFTKIELDDITPRSLGVLMASWENKTILNSLFWNINAFDQWGVELGKQNTKNFTTN